MIHGLDTGFLVAFEVDRHPDYLAARAKLNSLIASGDQVGIAPQVLAEFIHVVSDRRRFAKSVDVASAIRAAQRWWSAREVMHVFPNDAATKQWLEWLAQFHLGRKRLLDTLVASTYQQAGIHSILTTNPADFAVFGIFHCITPNDQP